MPLLTPDPTFHPSPTMATQSPAGTYACVVLSLKDLASSIWLWYRDPSRTHPNGSDGPWAVKEVIELPAEPANPENMDRLWADVLVVTGVVVMLK